jgi:hypothetical protein
VGGDEIDLLNTKLALSSIQRVFFMRSKYFSHAVAIKSESSRKNKDIVNDQEVEKELEPNTKRKYILALELGYSVPIHQHCQHSCTIPHLVPLPIREDSTSCGIDDLN